MVMSKLKMFPVSWKSSESQSLNNKVTFHTNAVVDMLGDKVIKSDSPLVSSKIDFADFLSLIVTIFLILGR